MARSYKKGFTLVELISCIVIIASLSAFLFPVFSQAKLESKVVSAKLGLRNAFMAFQLYRNDQDHVEYGDPVSMGLPMWTDQFGEIITASLIMESALGKDASKWSPCGALWMPDETNNIHYLPAKPDWNRWVNKLESNTVLLSDPNCNSASPRQINQQFFRKRAIGVMLDGHVVSRWSDTDHFFTQDFFLHGE